MEITILAGDLNIHPQNLRSSQLSLPYASQGFHLAITKATRQNKNNYMNSSLLDHIWFRRDLWINSATHMTPISDHLPIVCLFTSPNYKHFNINKLQTVRHPIFHFQHTRTKFQFYRR